MFGVWVLKEKLAPDKLWSNTGNIDCSDHNMTIKSVTRPPNVYFQIHQHHHFKRIRCVKQLPHQTT